MMQSKGNFPICERNEVLPVFDPKTNRYPYPEDTDRHYLRVHKNRGIRFDTTYPYVDKSLSFRFRQSVVRFLLHLIVFPVTRIRLGLRVEGRENLKKHRDVLQKGVVSCSNHVHLWDFLSILYAVRPFRPNVLSWAPNINGENGTLIRMVGGIPIPDTGLDATRAYVQAIHQLLADGGWLHVYAEGSMWEFYAPIRPFKRGASLIACENDKPILPLGFSYREPGWIRKHIFRQIACFTLRIGEPIFPDPNLPKKDRRNDLTRRSHEAVCRLAGIDPAENLYPPLFNDSKRIDYYTTEYGVGYKG